MKTRKKLLKWKRRLRRQYQTMTDRRALLKRIIPKLAELEATIKRIQKFDKVGGTK